MGKFKEENYFQLQELKKILKWMAFKLCFKDWLGNTGIKAFQARANVQSMKMI